MNRLPAEPRDQAAAWSAIAADYEREFVDPYRADAINPLLDRLRALPDHAQAAVADLGCGKGPLLPLLAQKFAVVHAVDFAEEMLRHARQRCVGLGNVRFHHASLTDLGFLHGQLDLAVAVNSLVMPDVRDIETALIQIRRCLKPGGTLLGIVPAMDGVHYWTMLLVDRALRRGMPLEAAQKNAAHLAEHQYFDFAFSRFRFRGIEQHFWHPFEIPYRLRRAGFRDVRVDKVLLSWEHFRWREEFVGQEPPWDWFFAGRVE
ncbi:MAG: class I SAM-dependent methyltransferase [Gemmatales bacterium]|nr:class I SAM-dependent methyltransferase [Gemmatales bacterium]MDW8386575.1 class I SAM-dependent methyltransferase [Gemmatales bacterium]